MPKKVFISYSHDDATHVARVRKLADSLRKYGVVCFIDQYEQDWAQGDGALCMQRWIEESDLVLVVCTEIYKRRIEKSEAPRTGQGAKWEGLLIRNLLYDNDSANTKFVPVLFDPKDEEHRPLPLKGAHYYLVNDQPGFDRLYAYLTDQNPDPAPPVGEVVTLTSVPPHPVFDRPGSPQVQPRSGSSSFFAPSNTLSSQADFDEVTNFRAIGLVPNPLFVGRERELSSLRSTMFPVHGATVAHRTTLTQGFTGEGGIGKTQLAQRFAERSCSALGGGKTLHGVDWDLFDCVWWLDGSSEGHAPAARTLAVHLGYTPHPSDAPSKYRSEIRARLQDSRRHLLVLDNVDPLDDSQQALDGGKSRWAVAEGWALPLGSRMLITTRDKQLPKRIAPHVEVGVLSQSDAGALLRSTRADLTDAKFDSSIDAVTDYLGCLALAVDMARAWLDCHPGSTPDSLLTLLQGSDAAAVALFESDELKDQAHNYRLSVARALSLHMDALAGSPAERLLHAAAFAAPNRIPGDLLRDVAGDSADEAREGLAALARKSVVQLQPGEFGGFVSMHRMTQLVVRARIIGQGAERFGDVLTSWLEHLLLLFVGRDQGTELRGSVLGIPEQRAALPHAVQVAEIVRTDLAHQELTSEEECICELVGLLIERTSSLQRVLGERNQAASELTRTIEWLGAKVSPPAAVLASLRTVRAGLKQDSGDFAGAEADLGWSFEWRSSGPDCDNESATAEYVARARLRASQGDLDGALADIRYALEREERHPEPNERASVCLRLTLASIQVMRRELPQAEANIQRAFVWAESQTQLPDFERTSLLYSRASYRVAAEDYEGAEVDIDTALGLLHKAACLDDRSIAILRGVRAQARLALGKAASALADVQAVIAWFARQDPKNERELAIHYATRARISLAMGDLLGAEADIDRSLAWFTTQNPLSPRELAIHYTARAGIRARRGKLAGAEADLGEAIRYAELQSPADPHGGCEARVLRARILETRARSSRALREMAKARDLFTRAMADIAHVMNWFETRIPVDDRALSAARADLARIEAAAKIE